MTTTTNPHQDYRNDEQIGASVARRVSAALKAAGFTKAGRYSSFRGYDIDGYIAKGNPGRPTSTVMFTGFRHDDPANGEIAAKAADAIRAAFPDFIVQVEGRGGVYVRVARTADEMGRDSAAKAQAS